MRLSLLRNVKFGPQIKELRVHLCQTGEESKGARFVNDLFGYAINSDLFTFFNCREFVQKFYVNIKRENPTTPILIRECSGVQPRLWTRMGNCNCWTLIKSLDVKVLFVLELGQEKSVPLTNVSSDGILKLVENLK